MHIDLTISLGNILTWAAFVGTVIRVETFLHRIDKAVLLILQEHEILIRDYCQRKNVNLTDLPTRFEHFDLGK